MNKDTEIITAYINGELEGQELKDFENQIKQDSELSAKVEEMRSFKAFLADKDFRNFRQTMRKIAAENSIKEVDNPKIATGKISSFKKWLSAAVILLLAIAAYWAYNFLNPTMTTEQLLAEYFPKIEASETRGAAIDLQAQKNIVEASVLLQQGETGESRQLLNQNLEPPEIEIFLKSQTQFYIAGSFLAENNLEACKSTLQLLIDDPQAHHRFRKKAALLLEKLSI